MQTIDIAARKPELSSEIHQRVGFGRGDVMIQENLVEQCEVAVGVKRFRRAGKTVHQAGQEVSVAFGRDAASHPGDVGLLDHRPGEFRGQIQGCPPRNVGMRGGQVVAEKSRSGTCVSEGVMMVIQTNARRRAAAGEIARRTG